MDKIEQCAETTWQNKELWYKVNNNETTYKTGFKDGYHKGTEQFEAKEQFALPKDILGLWEQTICEIRSEIKSWDLKGPHVTDYAKELCDKLEHSMCALAGGKYNLRYTIE